MRNIKMSLPEYVRDFAEYIRTSYGGETYVVGGACRDTLFGEPVKDYDLVVFLVPEDTLLHDPVLRVGAAGHRFGVYLVSLGDSPVFEVALPQVRHTDPNGDRSQELAEVYPYLSLAQDAARRDYTINTLYYSVDHDRMYDPTGYATGDIHDRRLRMVNPENFGHDPLRILRGMQFCSRYKLTAESNTAHAAYQHRHLLVELSLDRVREEWIKWAKGWYPSYGLRYLQAIDALPEILRYLQYTEQDPYWHPEGTVWEHTCRAVDAVLENFSDDDDPLERATLVFAALLHDVGKPETTFTNDLGRIVSPGHAQVSVDLVDDFFSDIAPAHSMRQIARTIKPLIGAHMWYVRKPGRKAVGRLINRLGPYASVEQLYQLMYADQMGRGVAGTLPVCILDALRIAEEIGATQGLPEKIVTGTMLLSMGFEPGPAMGRIIAAAYQAQLDGEFDNEIGGKYWVVNQY